MLTKVDADGAGRSDKAEVAVVSTVPGEAVSVRTR